MDWEPMELRECRKAELGSALGLQGGVVWYDFSSKGSSEWLSSTL